MTDRCLFCKIVTGDIPAAIVMQDDHVLAFRDIHPQAPVHVLVIPRQHVTSLHEANDPQLLGRLMTAAASVACQEGIDASGYRVVVNTNGDGGQTVFHLHAHVLGGRSLAWPPG